MTSCVDQPYPETQLFWAKESSRILKSETVEKEHSKWSHRNSEGELIIGFISWCKDLYVREGLGWGFANGYNVAVAGLNFVKERYVYLIFSPLIILSIDRKGMEKTAKIMVCTHLASCVRVAFWIPWSRNASTKRSTYQILSRPYLHLTPLSPKQYASHLPGCVKDKFVGCASLERFEDAPGKAESGSKRCRDKMEQDVSKRSEILGLYLGIGYLNLTGFSKDIRNWMKLIYCKSLPFQHVAGTYL